MTRLGMKDSEGLHHLHGIRIPLNDLLRQVTFIARQRRSGSSEAELGIFNNGFAGTNRIEEVSEVIEMVAVSVWSFEYDIFFFRTFPLFGGPFCIEEVSEVIEMVAVSV